MFTNTFLWTGQQYVDASSVDIFLLGHLKLMFSATTVNEETLQRSQMSVKQFATAPGPLKLCDIPWSDVSELALIKMKFALNIWSIWCEM